MIVGYLLFGTYGIFLFSINSFLLKNDKEITKAPLLTAKGAAKQTNIKKSNPLLLFGITLLSALSMLFFSMTIAPQAMSKVLFGIDEKKKQII